MTLYRWLYRSTARLDADAAPAALTDIVQVSILRNSALGVTGALMFTGKSFAQYVEGPEPAILALKASILRDQRHAEVATLAEGNYARRLFSGWSLAYAGPSRFVAETVERAIARSGSSYDGTRRLVAMLLEFAGD